VLSGYVYSGFALSRESFFQSPDRLDLYLPRSQNRDRGHPHLKFATLLARNPTARASTDAAVMGLDCRMEPFCDSSYTDHMSIVGNIAGIVKGMSITFGEMLQPTQVENYPDGAGPNRGAIFEQRYRGAHVLQRDENGLEKCVACFLCAAACPSNCILIEAAENTEEQRISSSERYAKVYNIDYNRCIFCGYCVEACPTDAITHGHGFELATLNATNLVMRKEDMLVQIGVLAAK